MNDLLRALGISFLFTFLVVLVYGIAQALFGKPTASIEIVEVGKQGKEEESWMGIDGCYHPVSEKKIWPGQRKFTNWPTNYQAAWVEQMQHESIFREQDIHFAQTPEEIKETEERWSTIHPIYDANSPTFLWGMLNGAVIEFQPTQASIPTVEPERPQWMPPPEMPYAEGLRYVQQYWQVPDAYRISDEQTISLEDARRILDLADARDPDNVAEAEDAWEIAHYLLETPTWQEVVKSEWVRPLEFTPCFEQIVWAVLDGEDKYGKLP